MDSRLRASMYAGFMGRAVTSPELPPDARAQLDELAEAYEVEAQVLYGRILEWFADLPPLHQMLALGRLPPREHADTAVLDRGRQFATPPEPVQQILEQAMKQSGDSAIQARDRQHRRAGEYRKQETT